MDKRMDASVIDAIAITATNVGGHVELAAKVPPDAGVIDGFLGLFRDRDLDMILGGGRSQRGFDLDYVTATYDKDAVHVSATDDTLIVPLAAFDRLLARLARAAIDTAKKTGAAVTREAWWAKAVEDGNAVIARAYPKGL